MKQFFACCLAAAAMSLSPHLRAQQAPNPISTFNLPNGMTLVVKPDRRAPTAVHMVWLRVGSMDEVDGLSGVAHVLEHMLFKGTPSVKAGEFSRRVAALGGRENAFTSRDYTGYFQQIPAQRLAEVMQLEADRFANNRWADEEFVKELEVVKEERRMRTEDAPRAMLYEQLSAVQFSASPYRRPIVGWMEDLDAMKPDDARAFYKQWYSPANAVVVVVGDVVADEVHRLALTHYGPIPARALPERKPRTEPPQRGLRRGIELVAGDFAALALEAPGLDQQRSRGQGGGRLEPLQQPGERKGGREDHHRLLQRGQLVERLRPKPLAAELPRGRADPKSPLQVGHHVRQRRIGHLRRVEAPLHKAAPFAARQHHRRKVTGGAGVVGCGG